MPLVVAPIAFVSEHSETLVELDMTYRREAEKGGVPVYVRVPALGDSAAFIAGLAATIRGLLRGAPRTCSAEGRRLCPPGFGRCPMALGVEG